MTAFSKCIDSAIESGKLTEEKGEQAKQFYKDALADAEAEGLRGRAAEDQAALIATDHITHSAKVDKWQKVNEIRASHKLWKKIAKSDRPDMELDDLFNRIEFAKERIMRQATARLTKTINAFRPRTMGFRNPTEHMDNVIKEVFGGSTGDSVARDIAKEIVEANEWLRQRANREGTSIPQLKNRGLPQSQDRFKLLELRKKLGNEGARERWLKDHMENLDWETMRFGGKKIPSHKREEVLNASYDAILTNGNNRLVPSHRGTEALATRMNHQRFFFYKNAEAWSKMQEAYGAGNVFEQVVSSMEIMSRDISLLEQLGPNPTTQLNFASNIAKKRAADIDIAGTFKDRKTMTARVSKESNIMENRFRIFNHLVSNGSESWGAQFIISTRTAVTASVLSKAFLANLGDIGFQTFTLKEHGFKYARPVARVVDEFRKVPNDQRAMTLARSGLGLESALNMALNNQRYLGPMEGSAWAKRYADIMFRSTGLTAWTQASRHAFGLELMGQFADHQRTRFKDLPYRESMEAFGLTEKDWDVFRKTKLHQEEGATFLRPIDMDDREVSDRIFDYMLHLEKRAVPTPDTRVQQTLGLHQDADTVFGVVGRLFSTVKSFPVTVFMVHLRDVWAAPTAGGKVAGIVRFFLMLTASGALITQVKELAAGRDPRDMTDPAFWGRAVLNGGSLGFAGDALLGDLNANGPGGGLSGMFAGPIVDFYDDTRNLTIGQASDFILNPDKFKASDVGRKAIRYSEQYAPIPWWADVTFERAVFDEMLRATDPSGYRRMVSRERRRDRDLGQTRWWGAGQAPTVPRLQGALGEQR